MYLDFYQIFQQVNRLPEWTVDSLSHYFQVPSSHFKEVAPGIILAEPARTGRAVDFLIQGAIFFQKGRIAVRGMPAIFYGSAYQKSLPVAFTAEQELLDCLDQEPLIFEQKYDGLNIRLYQVAARYYFATRFQYNAYKEKSDLNPGELTQKIVEQKYPEAYALADSGYVPVFELLSPAFADFTQPTKSEDLILIDILKDNKFVKRAEKEALARKYQLRLPPIIATLEQPVTSRQFLKRMKSLEYQCHQLGIEGVVGKTFQGDSDQVFIKIKAQNIRTDHLGTPEIPKRFILEAVEYIRLELTRTEFVDRQYGLGKIIDTLSDDFIITPENRQKIEQYYEEKRTVVDRELRAFNRARQLFAEHQFQSTKEMALFTRNEDQLVRFFLFQLGKGN